jgi:hypothetical protein
MSRIPITLVALSLTFISAIFSVGKASVESLIYSGTYKCTALNCGAVVINGISVKNTFGNSVPFTIQVGAFPIVLM